MSCCTFPKGGYTRLPGNHSPIFPLSIPRTGHSECRSSVVGGPPLHVCSGLAVGVGPVRVFGYKKGEFPDSA